MDHPSIPSANDTNPTTPVETSISKATFRTLPIDVQKDYARFYDLPDTESLTTDDICGVLFRETDWTPALEIEGHVRHVTADGVAVARDIMDLVDWLVEHYPNNAQGSAARPPTPLEANIDIRLVGSPAVVIPFGATIEAPPTHDGLERMAEQLQQAHGRINTAIEESRKAALEACGHLFVLQNALQEENTYQHRVLESITSSVGIDHIHGMQKPLNSITDDPQREAEPLNLSKYRIRKRSRRTIPRLYHKIQYPQASHGSASGAHTSIKRSLEADDVHDLSASNILDGSSHIHKRPRIDEHSDPRSIISPLEDEPIPPTILNYPSDDNHDEGDSSYSNSEGTETDSIDDEFEFYGRHGKLPAEELLYVSSSSEEYEISSNSMGSFCWSQTESDSDCSSDLDYYPNTPWTLEDAFELIAAGNFNEWACVDVSFHFGAFDIYPLYYFKYMDELLDCGGALSDGDVSTDDSEQGYLDPEMIQRSAFTRDYPAKSLGLLLRDPIRDIRGDVDFIVQSHTYTEERIAELKQEQIMRTRQSRWQLVLMDVFDPLPGWGNINVDQRLNEILTSDHPHFNFDDEEWNHFVQPSSGVFDIFADSRPIL